MICKKIVLTDLASPLGDAAQFGGCEELLEVVAATTVELLEIWTTNAECITESVCEYNRDFEEQYELGYIQALSRFVLAAEVLSLSASFKILFDDWNATYFSARLPSYSVRVVFDLHTFANEPVFAGSPSSGLIRFAEQCIYIRYEEEEMMLGMLIHEMAHAATDGNHDEAWNNEMKRLRLAGAPVLAFDIE